MKYILSYNCRDCDNTISTNLDINSNIDDLLNFLREFNFECEKCFSTVGNFSVEENPPKSKHKMFYVNPITKEVKEIP